MKKMNEKAFTKEDYEGYTAYAKALWDLIISIFADKLSVQLDRPDLMDALKAGMKTVTDSAIPQLVYQNSLLSMYQWMKEDCPFTGHKGKAPSSNTSGIQEAIDEAFATGKDVVMPPPHNVEPSPLVSGDRSVCKNCGAPIVFIEAWGRLEWYHSLRDKDRNIYPFNRNCPNTLLPAGNKVAEPLEGILLQDKIDTEGEQ